ncbi:hypothetical protein R3P38DRAFT_3282445 [Favolaschia claudopus]|uniref:F-box domain-containing protein n=1 Tax=Favolaschia claudopus TaxID=2862362 RepID=A0AAW0ACU4_9AGAR
MSTPPVSQRAPPEILSQIFRSTAPFTRTVGSCQVPIAPWPLSHVCKEWRQAAQCDAMLWSEIKIHIKQTPRSRGPPLSNPEVAYPLAALQTQLYLSANVPLSIEFSAPIYSPQLRHVRALLETLARHSQRWARFAIDAGGVDSDDTLFGALSVARGRLDALSRLSFKGWDWPPDLRDIFDAPARWTAPNLAFLKFSLVSPEIDNVRVLLHRCTQVRGLSMISGCDCESSDVINILKEVPSVTHLELAVDDEEEMYHFVSQSMLLDNLLPAMTHASPNQQHDLCPKLNSLALHLDSSKCRLDGYDPLDDNAHAPLENSLCDLLESRWNMEASVRALSSFRLSPAVCLPRPVWDRLEKLKAGGLRVEGHLEPTAGDSRPFFCSPGSQLMRLPAGNVPRRNFSNFTSSFAIQIFPRGISCALIFPNASPSSTFSSARATSQLPPWLSVAASTGVVFAVCVVNAFAVCGGCGRWSGKPLSFRAGGGGHGGGICVEHDDPSPPVISIASKSDGRSRRDKVSRLFKHSVTPLHQHRPSALPSTTAAALCINATSSRPHPHPPGHRAPKHLIIACLYPSFKNLFLLPNFRGASSKSVPCRQTRTDILFLATQPPPPQHDRQLFVMPASSLDLQALLQSNEAPLNSQIPAVHNNVISITPESNPLEDADDVLREQYELLKSQMAAVRAQRMELKEETSALGWNIEDTEAEIDVPGPMDRKHSSHNLSRDIQLMRKRIHK